MEGLCSTSQPSSQVSITPSSMAPTTDRDEEDTTNETSKPANPFIKFRQFADSQISSLLQGIVGLPSAFSKNPNNGRWAEFDEDMRRRDELQKRQNGLRDSETGKNEVRWPSWAKAEPDDEEMDDRFERDIPLYSPVSRSLFSQLRCSKEDDGPKNDWKPWDEGSGIAFQPSIYSTLKGQVPIKVFQTAVYHDLQSSPVFRSDYSLLPYMLFSPYSPYHLGYHRKEADHLNYDAAFIDLMLATQNRPMSSMPLQTACILPIEPQRNLLYSMWAHGVLQQKSVTKYPSVISFQDILNGDLSSGPEKLSTSKETSPWDPETELELYERFLHRASSSIGVADVIESFFNDAQDWVQERLESLDPSEFRRQLEEVTGLPLSDIKRQLGEVTGLLGQETGNQVEDERRAKAMKVLRSLFDLPAEVREIPEERRRVPEKFSETKIAKELEEFKSQADPEKVISSSTSTDRKVNEDGSVETSVTVYKEYADGEKVEASCTKTEHIIRDGSVSTNVEVWKQYADGRTTITSTSHNEELPYDRGQSTERENKPDEKKNEKIDEKRKGWFWN